MKLIQDPIHGLLRIEDWIIKLIDTPEFQRLRRISQIGFANLVYPGANHTRFEHSLGVMHIAKQLTEKMDISDDEKREIIASALLHDIGHAPFSHCSEGIIRKYIRIKHEDVEWILKNGEIYDAITEIGLDVNKIIKHIKGKTDCDIISGDIDADRMDYLVRDSYYTGVAYGVFDLSRLINKITFDGKKMIIESKGLRAAESLLISRFLMYPTVYFHHVCRIARKMFEKAVEFCIEEGFLDAVEFLRMDDYEITCFLRKQEGYPSEIMRMIDSRKLFKRAVYVGLDKIGLEIQRINPKIAEIEIAEAAGVDPKWIAVDIPRMEEPKEFKALVRMNGEIRRLDEVSSIVKALKSAERDIWRVGVYTKKEFVEEVRKASIDYFKIEKTLQKRLDEMI